MKKKVRELTVKQQKFCQEYVKDFNASQACIRAGYSKKTAGEQGYQLLQKTSIQLYIAKLVKKKERKSKLSAKYVLNKLHDLVERCMEGEELTDKEGLGLGVWKFDSHGANSALDKLGKYFGLWNDQIIQVKITSQVQVFLDQIIEVVVNNVGDSDTRGKIQSDLERLGINFSQN